MGDEIDTGGFVYPQVEHKELARHKDSLWSTVVEDRTGGISRRDWLAGLAMQGIISHGEIHSEMSAEYNGKQFPEVFAEWAYDYADAMIEQGKK